MTDEERLDRQIGIVLWIIAPLTMLYAKLAMRYILRDDS